VDEIPETTESTTHPLGGGLFAGPAVSDAQSALDALRESESRFRMLAECAPVVVWMTDINARRTYISRYWTELTGRDPQEDLGFKWLEAVHPDDREHARRVMIDASRMAQPSRVEFRVERFDHDYAWLSHHGVPLFHADGSYSGHVGTSIDITEHKVRETAGHRLKDNLIAGQEAERQRVARELHDGIGQRIALLAMALKDIERLAERPSSALDQKLRAAEDELAEIASDVHRLSHNLHPSTITYLGLLPALRRLCREVSEQTNVAVEFAGPSDAGHLPEDVGLALFRVAQECLANVAKHSRSPSAAVLLAADSGELRLTISDNGAGFDVTRLQVSGGLGLISIQERARMLGADLTIRSSVTKGTTVELRVPRQAAATQGHV
jgi:PAS domain S-box-containing protein